MKICSEEVAMLCEKSVGGFEARAVRIWRHVLKIQTARAVE